LSEVQPDEKARQRSTQMVVLFVSMTDNVSWVDVNKGSWRWAESICCFSKDPYCLSVTLWGRWTFLASNWAARLINKPSEPSLITKKERCREEK
jgi:hypothetical protein